VEKFFSEPVDCTCAWWRIRGYPQSRSRRQCPRQPSAGGV